MRRFLFLVVLLPLAVVIILLSVANRHSVTVSLDPFHSTAPALSFTAPLFVIFFVALAAGIVIGGIAAWLRQAHWRRKARAAETAAERAALAGGPSATAGSALPPTRRAA
jgi:uncharacterized integral membrane protein